MAMVIGDLLSQRHPEWQEVFFVVGIRIYLRPLCV